MDRHGAHKSKKQGSDGSQINSVTIYIDEYNYFKTIYVYLRQNRIIKEPSNQKDH